MIRLPLLFLLLVVVSNTAVAALTIIQVCQNKDCCKRYKTQSMNLVHTINNLLPPSSIQVQGSSDDIIVRVEATGCLSQCDKGPNVAIMQQDNDSKEQPTIIIHNDICDHFSAAAILPIEPPPLLLTAVSVMEKAEKGTYCTLVLVLASLCLFCLLVGWFISGCHL
jgi:hypothetical protein